MEYKFSDRSKAKLATCHPDLQMLFNAVGRRYNCTILEGHRDEARQNMLFEQGKSKLQFPKSKHNQSPSLAVDVAPYPLDWSNTPKNMYRWYHFCGYVKAMADTMGIKIRGGHDWDGDMDFTDQTFDDLPHFELID